MLKIICLIGFTTLVNAYTISNLFDGLKEHSQTKIDKIMVKVADISREQTISKLYPSVDLFASYNHYTMDTSMVPISPNVSAPMIKDQTIAQPFSKNIYRYGASFSMPIYIKSIYTYTQKAKAMQQSAKSKQKLNLIKNEAIIIGSNATLEYLKRLSVSLDTKLNSLLETKKTLKIKVDNGRSPAYSLYQIDDALNQINISKNNILLQQNNIINIIESMTGVRLKGFLKMQQLRGYTTNDFKSLDPLKKKIKANLYDIQAQKDKLYPSVKTFGSYTFSDAKAYNNGDNIGEEYGNVGVSITIPLFQPTQYKQIEKSKVELLSTQTELQKTKDELVAKSNMLKKSLTIYDSTIKLSKESIQNKLKILKIEKINYNSGRISTQDYLRYEDDVVEAKANLYQAKAKKWQALMELAVVYANNIEELVR